jgi:hypothetical protein
MSWEDLEPPVADIREVTQQREDTDRLFLRIFHSEDGEKLLEILRKWYVDPPVATPGHDASFAYYREGQRMVIQDIETRIRRALHG